MHFIKNYSYLVKMQEDIVFNIFRSLSSMDNWENHFTSKHLKEIERKWKNDVIRNTNDDKSIRFMDKKKYVLSMFPYPSGNLHMGHVRVYTISDVLARFYQMKGYKVIHPMGWDAFGLPAENAAIERGENPESWTRNNITRMKKQLKDLGCKFDWWREFATCDSQYYKWTQFIFLRLFHAGLVYRQEAMVNWDPVDQTVLANEQVDENGCSWRSGAKVENKSLTQWFIKTTSLCEELYDDLSDPMLKNWRDIPHLQRGWIGDCDGYIIEMKIKDSNSNYIHSIKHLPVWMKEPELMEKIAFLSVKSSHILNKSCFVDSKCHDFCLLNVKAVNPITNKKIPVIVNNELNCKMGSEIYVGLPLTNENDKEFCIKLGIDIPTNSDFTLKNISREDILKKLIDANTGGYKSSANLRDWLVSRQRFWGTPIPVVYCDTCGTVPVPEKDLPVELPKLEGLVMKGVSALKENKSWYHCSCPRCGNAACRETDTMDTFVDSSWYYLRFLDPHNRTEIVDKDNEKNWMPVDIYIGGKEHALLHLYFARFIQKSLLKLGLVSHKEPFQQLLVQGMVKSKAFQVKESGKYLKQEEVDFSVSPPVEKDTKLPLNIQYEKMSKSKHNGVDPQSLIDDYGVDAVRLAILAKVGPQSERFWDPRDLDETFKILSKIWKIARQFVLTRDQGAPSSNVSENEKQWKEHETFLFESRNQLLLRASHFLENSQQFHSSIRCLQQLSTALLRVPVKLIWSNEYEKGLRTLLLFFAPMCPHFSSELWQRIRDVSTPVSRHQNISIFDEPWPTADPSYKMEIDCKVNEEDILILRISQEDFSILTEEKAMKLAQENEVLSSIITNIPLISVDYKHHPNYKATLSIMTKTPKEIRRMKKAKKSAKRASSA